MDSELGQEDGPRCGPLLSKDAALQEQMSGLTYDWNCRQGPGRDWERDR